ncbi:MAG: fused response regulator/phosphatase [Solirubrobacteraceae bacterium]
MIDAKPDQIGVLLIEDDDGDALLVQELLDGSSFGARLVRGRTLREAVGELPGDIQCVLLDLGLPDATGLESVRRVRAAAPATAVIVLTGDDDAAVGEAAVQAGAQDYLVKGHVDGGMLARAIRYAVGRRQAEEVAQQLRVAEIRADENARLERGLVPKPIVHDPSIWIASRYLPGGRRGLLGGDFFDAIETADGSLRVMIGDVAGRGPDEAALGAGLRVAWRALVLSGAAGESVLAALQRVIEHERQVAGTFATLCALEIAPGRRALRLWRAGHPPPLLIDGVSVTSLPVGAGGPPIGMFTDAVWPQLSCSLPAQWAILLYTDGVIEGRVGEGADRLGESGLRRLVGDYVARDPGWRRDPDALLRCLVTRTRELNGGELGDDVAMLLVGPVAAAGR